MWDDLWRSFTEKERAVLCQATADDVMQPAGTLNSAVVPEPLRAKFMAAVIRRMSSIPLPT